MNSPRALASCPSSDDWNQYLSGITDAVELDTHLADCPFCLATLEHLTALPPAPRADGSALPRGGEDALLGRLRGLIGQTDSPPAPTVVDAELPWYPGYEVRRELGRGGLAVVHEAYHLRLNRTVAIKRMKNWAAATPEQLVRFNSDAKFLARLRHPGVIEIYEAALYDGQPYSVLELVPGGSLEDALPGEPVDLRDAAIFMAEVARTVQYLHSHGVLHCDIKPGNILLDLPMANGPHRLARRCPKIIDFGLAEYREQDVQLTRNSDVIGTPQYMAPEMLDGRNQGASVAADVYSIGAVLYQLIAGRPPASGATRAEVIQSVRTGSPPPPSQHRDTPAPGLDAVCLRCLNQDPARRYADAAAVADALITEVSGFTPDRSTGREQSLIAQLDVARATLEAARQMVDAAASTTDPAQARQMLRRAYAMAATLDEKAAAAATGPAR